MHEYCEFTQLYISRDVLTLTQRICCRVEPHLDYIHIEGYNQGLLLFVDTAQIDEQIRIFYLLVVLVSQSEFVHQHLLIVRLHAETDQPILFITVVKQFVVVQVFT